MRTAKIQLLQLLNDCTPVEQFDVTGNFDFSDALKPLDDIRQLAVDTRPDLRAAMMAIAESQANNKLALANGSTDPTFSAWDTYNSSNNNPNGLQTLGAQVQIPLRIFDRNQGEKKRTLIDFDRARQQSDVARAQVFSDVDSAYAQLESNLTLLKPYKAKYRDQSTRVRDTITYSYQHGGAVGSEFLPHLDEGLIWVRGTLPPSEGPTASIDFMNKARVLIASFPEVTQVVSQTGRPDDGTDTAGFFNTEYFVDLKQKKEWRPVFHQDKEKLIAAIDKGLSKFPGVLWNYSQPISDNMEEAVSGVRGEPFAIVIVGGLPANLFIVIFLLPALYVWFARKDDVLPAPDYSESF